MVESVISQSTSLEFIVEKWKCAGIGIKCVHEVVGIMQDSVRGVVEDFDFGARKGDAEGVSILPVGYMRLQRANRFAVFCFEMMRSGRGKHKEGPGEEISGCCAWTKVV